MKISKTKLRQIIKEEVASLAEAPIPPTKFRARKGPQEKRRDKDRGAVRDFFGSEDPLATRTGASPTPEPDVDQTLAIPPDVLSARAEEEKEEAEAKQATHRDLYDPLRVAITDFTDDVKEKLIEKYEQKTGIRIALNPLGSGAFGIVYKGENPEYGPVAVKFTLSGQEINAYRNILRLKDGLWDRDRALSKLLPTILDISTIASPPVRYVYDTPGRKFQAVPPGKIDPDAQTYKVFVIQMELLEKLDPDIRSDIFGPASYDEYPPEVRKRFVEEYLTIENIYSSLEHLLGDDWEQVLDSLDPGPESASGRGSLPIKDQRAFGPFREIDKLLPQLRDAYLEAPGENHFFALQDIHKILATKITHIFSKYLEDETLVGRLEGSAGLLLPAQMAANTKLPQYDPAQIQKHPGFRASILPPSELQSRVTKNFYKRLKRLENYSTQYGDIHAGNLMTRPNGDLVVADVGLFLFGRESNRGYAATIAERFRELAGIIIK